MNETAIKIDLTAMEKELRGVVHEHINGILKEFNIEKWIEGRVDRMIADQINTTIEKKVYAFLEEAEIEVPKENYYDKKITLNDYMIKVITEVAVNRATKMLRNLVITLKDDEKK